MDDCQARHWFPYAKLATPLARQDRVVQCHVDTELGEEGFYYQLSSGGEGAIHLDAVLEYNRDPKHMRDMLLYKLTLLALERMENSGLGRREVIRRLRTSPAQLYRLLDATIYRKSVDQMLTLLAVLDCTVDLVVSSSCLR